uniref:Uncharacterized protein n=1 Tax=Myoviridae sp. ctEBR14 TaxID=2825060 RepID=A0A8S5NWW9_9CAUD|nr:MAG TPA: hypothetical protein [Myoviridae sp. ctEBR14]
MRAFLLGKDIFVDSLLIVNLVLIIKNPNNFFGY